ncbi:MAG: monosaccharide transporter [Piptocephalis tieghemiana]|nr:MAG: monosaccharide transporter [Piptocephalis tieghemiana]
MSAVGKNRITPSGRPDSRDEMINLFVFMCTCIAALSAFNNGFNTGAPNTPALAIKNCDPKDIGKTFGCISMTDWIWGIAVGGFALGGAAGGLIAAPSTNRFGRRLVLAGANFAYIIGGILVALATGIAQMLIGRLFLGVGAGIGSVVAPLYLSEVASVKARGALGTVYQLSTTLGILITTGIGIPMANNPGWRYLFGITIPIAMIQLAILPFVVETPRWLVAKNHLKEAKDSLQKLRPGKDIDAEYREIIEGQLARAGQNSASIESVDNIDKLENGEIHIEPEKTMSLTQVAKSQFRRMLVVAILLHACQQLSGINGIMYYSTTLFTDAYGLDKARRLVVGVQGVNLLLTVISVFLIDRLGRKFLLIVSLAGMSASSLLMVIASYVKVSFLIVLAVNLFVAFFAVGLGPIPWLILPELFPTKAAGAATSAAIAVNWFCNFLIGFFFASMQRSWKSATFLFFMGFSLAGLFLVTLFLPETKGRTLAEIQQEEDVRRTTSQSFSRRHSSMFRNTMSGLSMRRSSGIGRSNSMRRDLHTLSNSGGGIEVAS